MDILDVDYYLHHVIKIYQVHLEGDVEMCQVLCSVLCVQIVLCDASAYLGNVSFLVSATHLESVSISKLSSERLCRLSGVATCRSEVRRLNEEKGKTCC